MSISERDLLVRNESNLSSENFRLIPSGQELIADLSIQAGNLKPGERFWVKGMVMQSGKAMSEIIKLAETSAAKGADVKLVTDPISLYSAGELPAFLECLPKSTPFVDIGKVKSTLKANQGMIEYIQGNPDLDFTFSPKPSLARHIFPFIGADHAKSIIVGNTLYFGDKNYDEDSFFNRAGFVIKITDPNITNAVAQELFEKSYSPDEPDTDINIDDQTRLIVDSGKHFRSLIYATAIDMVNDADYHVGMVLTTFPGIELTQAIEEAIKRDVDVHITTTHAKNLTGLHSYLIQRIGEKRLLDKETRPKLTFLEGRNRAKVLYTERGALWGSHNLVEEGIMLGTRESAIQTSNPVAIRNIRNYHKAVSESKIS